MASRPHETILSCGFFRFLSAINAMRFSSKTRTRCQGRRILIDYPNEEKLLCVPLMRLMLSGIQLAFFLETLRTLQEHNFLVVRQHSRKKLIVRLSGKGRALFNTLINIFPLAKMRNNNITINDIKLLYLINEYGFMPDIWILENKLSVSRQAINKMLKKHRSLGLIDEEGFLTVCGQLLLDFFEHMLDKRCGELLSCTPVGSLCEELTSRPKLLGKAIKVVAECLNTLISHSRYGRGGANLSILGIGDSLGILRIVESLYAEVEEKGLTVVDIFANIGSRKARNEKYSERKLERILTLLGSMSESDILVLVASSRLATEIAARASNSWPRRSVVMITRITRHLKLLRNNIPEIQRVGSRIMEDLMNAIAEGKSISLCWGEAEENVIHIMFRGGLPKNVPRSVVMLNSGILGETWCGVPFGVIRLNLELIGRFSRISGKIDVRSEPIYGLKCPSPPWPRSPGDDLHCRLRISMANRRPLVLLDEFKVLHVARRINQGILVGTRIGLNSATSEDIIGDIVRREPSLLQYIKGFLTLEILCNNSRTCYYVARDISIYADGRKIM